MKKSIQINKLKWHSPFYLDKPFSEDVELLNSRGVYLWIYKNKKYKKIIYVGSVWSKKGFIKRIKEEISDILTGQAFIFKIGENENPYDLLNKTDEELDNNFYYPERGSLEKDFSWVKDYTFQYLRKIQYWLCPIPENFENEMRHICQYLETQIQLSLKRKFNIKYINNDKNNLSWLGKLDKLSSPNLLDYEYKFSTLPDTDDNEILLNLYNEASRAL